MGDENETAHYEQLWRGELDRVGSALAQQTQQLRGAIAAFALPEDVQENKRLTYAYSA